MAALPNSIREAALNLGFAEVGFTSTEPLSRGQEVLENWLDAGYHGDLEYLETPKTRHTPEALLPGARTAIVLAMAYPGREPGNALPLSGQIAAYAGGEDYHRVMHERMGLLAERLEAQIGRSLSWRACVDTAPLLERELAARSGLGFIGKSAMLIVPGLGSRVLLGTLLVDVDIEQAPLERSRCGSCQSCLERCPTGAFVGPYILDARRCISYLTIEFKGIIPRELRPKIGAHVFGCDVCQDVCPFNASKKPKPVERVLFPTPERSQPSLERLLHLRAAEYRRLVKGSALRRVSRAQIGRNAAIALGNSGTPTVVPSLGQALTESRYPLIRGHAAWALGHLNVETAIDHLKAGRASEEDTWVREEIELALNRLAQVSARSPRLRIV